MMYLVDKGSGQVIFLQLSTVPPLYLTACSRPTVGKWTFPVFGAKLWNELPFDITSAPFMRRLSSGSVKIASDSLFSNFCRFINLNLLIYLFKDPPRSDDHIQPKRSDFTFARQGI